MSDTITIVGIIGTDPERKSPNGLPITTFRVASPQRSQHSIRRALTANPRGWTAEAIVWLLSEGRTTEEVCQVTGYSQAGCATLRQATTSSPRTAPSVQVRFLV